MKIKTFDAGRVEATKLSTLFVARNDLGSGFNIYATILQGDGFTRDITVKRYLTKHKADKELQILKAKLGLAVTERET